MLTGRSRLNSMDENLAVNHFKAAHNCELEEEVVKEAVPQKVARKKKKNQDNS